VAQDREECWDVVHKVMNPRPPQRTENHRVHSSLILAPILSQINPTPLSQIISPKSNLILSSHILPSLLSFLYVGTCHDIMTLPRVTDRGDGIPICRVAVNILNNQSRTADSGLFFSLWVGRRANNSSPQTNNLLRYISQGPRLGRIPVQAWKVVDSAEST
jgi:hypothetical protein